jgi:hypothetical protein
MRVLTIRSILFVVLGLLLTGLVSAAEPATITVRYSGGKSLAYTINQGQAGTEPVLPEAAADTVLLDPYGTTKLPRSIRIVFEEVPAAATGCGVVYKKGSRPPFKGFLMSIVDGKQVLMLTANTGSEQPEAFSIVCYDDAGAVVAEVDPMSDTEDPPPNWP